MKTYAVVGEGTAPAKAITQALEDLPLEKDDVFQMVWADGREDKAMGAIFDFVLGDEADESTQKNFVLYYQDGDEVEAWFREAPKGIVQKTRDVTKVLKDADVVLFLWDDTLDEDQLDIVFDAFESPVPVLALNNGLVPIVASDEVPEPLDATDYIKAREQAIEENESESEVDAAVNKIIEEATQPKERQRHLKVVPDNGEVERRSLPGLLHDLADIVHELYDSLEGLAHHFEDEVDDEEGA